MQAVVVFVNPSSNRGRTEKSLATLPDLLEEKGLKAEVVVSQSSPDLVNQIGLQIQSGKRFLISAGGDGTLQCCVDTLMKADPEVRKEIRLGAIGLGTSNDFHKPFSPERKIGNFPCRLDIYSPVLHDVIKVEHEDSSRKILESFCLQSCNLGLIPATNVRLTQSAFFRLFYRIAYQPALICATIWEILWNRGISGKLSIEGEEAIEGEFSGLSVIKRGHIAGNFVFKTKRCHDDELLDFVCCKKVSPIAMARITSKFESEGFFNIPNVFFRTGKFGEAIFTDTQPLDIDGEIVFAKRIKWKIFPRALKIMG